MDESKLDNRKVCGLSLLLNVSTFNYVCSCREHMEGSFKHNKDAVWSLGGCEVRWCGVPAGALLLLLTGTPRVSSVCRAGPELASKHRCPERGREFPSSSCHCVKPRKKYRRNVSIKDAKLSKSHILSCWKKRAWGPLLSCMVGVIKQQVSENIWRLLGLKKCLITSSRQSSKKFIPKVVCMSVTMFSFSEHVLQTCLPL